jgi:arginine decarboxylase
VLSENDLALCDRNCHKSIEQGLINSGAIPVYLVPTRNRYGIIGPVLPSELTREAIKSKIAASPLKISGDTRAYAVLTNCTYDGLCYNACAAESTLANSVDRIHFDEAWYAYAKFNPMYHRHFAMRKDRNTHSCATVFATHSTHKLLAALSQSSYIHMRCGKKAPSPDQLNQGYLLNTSTSPLYAICASNDIAVKMMAENGFALTQEVIDEAVDFRQALARIEREFTQNDSWFFKVWNAPHITDPDTGKVYDFADAPKELLTTCQDCWKLRAG